MTKVPFCKLLHEKLQHPYILPYINSDYRADKRDVVVFREFCPKGSLKDMVYRGLWSPANPRDPYIKKYAGTGKPLPVNDIAKYGRQILDVSRLSFSFSSSSSSSSLVLIPPLASYSLFTFSPVLSSFFSSLLLFSSVFL
jgi:hypothetical protein